ncbi:uncharacterized protein BHQ10_000330 [Talaromyces amestolkiae]|uniref:C2H2-type domain-containing protein n=1 Tax=Talaromyces amestolkiae TaxID=1196081 RepID=A0A364KL89_TALAM|nr:uncharacterized protein BHQ10_000330 [Talaromyces amestolkiae]RAO64318.1 hypothetical protein BHQ10_000330 [Talaromyces amestolkiae]
MNAPVGAGDLLHYNAQHKLLICLECKYAIQKHAVDSHLLRHKIYRGERQQLLSAISELEIPEAGGVRFPTEPCEPVDGLPVIDGYKCTARGGCGSLYASVKRMRRHWSESHGLTDLPEGYASAVHMQTFFRGTKVRGVLLEHFSNLPYQMAEKLGRPNAPIDFLAVMSAIGALIDCCRQTYDANDAGSAWMGLEKWLEKVSGRFTELLVTEKSPAALIVFAQWLLLVAMAERFCWFLRGVAMKMLHLIMAELEEHGTFRDLLKQLMGWALESV